MSDGASPAEILFEHYKDAAEEFHGEIRLRAKLVYTALAILVLLLFKASAPDTAERLLNGWIERQIEKSEPGEPAPPPPPLGAGGQGEKVEKWVDLRFLTSVLWFGMSSVMILYYARSLRVELQARYLRDLEGRLAELTGRILISRFLDARAYRPLYLRSVNYLYSGLVMILLALAMGFILYKEVLEARDEGWSLFVVIDVAVGLFTLLMTVIFGISFAEVGRSERSAPRG